MIETLITLAIIVGHPSSKSSVHPAAAFSGAFGQRT